METDREMDRKSERRSNLAVLAAFALSAVAAFWIPRFPLPFEGANPEVALARLRQELFRGFDGAGYGADELYAPERVVAADALGNGAGRAREDAAEASGELAEAQGGADGSGAGGAAGAGNGAGEDGARPGEAAGQMAGTENSEEQALEGGQGGHAGTLEITEGSPSAFTLSDALFIGDSRTVGLAEYSGIQDADFYSFVGMSVYNIFDKEGNYNDEGKMTLEEALSLRSYGKIYVMIGINEIAMDNTATLRRYADLLDFLRERQPDALLIVEANLHVTAQKSGADKRINNENLNNYNAMLKGLADGERTFYLDANVHFDDESGALDGEKSGDGVHLLGKYYAEWGTWISQMSELLLTGEIRETVASGKALLVQDGDLAAQVGRGGAVGTGEESMGAGGA